MLMLRSSSNWKTLLFAHGNILVLAMTIAFENSGVRGTESHGTSLGMAEVLTENMETKFSKGSPELLSGKLLSSSSIEILKQPEEAARSMSHTAKISNLLKGVVEANLPGCFKIILNHDPNTFKQELITDLVSEIGEGVVLWDLETFFESPPKKDVYIFTHGHSRTKGLYCVLFMVFGSLQEVGRTFEQLQSGSWLQGSTKYMLVYTGGTITMDALSSDPVLGSSYNLVVMSPTTNQNQTSPLEFQFFQTCPYCDNGNPTVNLIAAWNSKEGFDSSEPFYPDLFQNFNGHLFRAVTLVYEPFSCYDKVSEDVLIPTGNCVDNTMLHEMSLALNFTYKFTEPSDGQWGHKLDNGSYTGVIGSVERMEADFSLNIAITQDREEVVDCTIGYHIEPITFCTSKPRPLNQAFALIRPFRTHVWVAFGLIVVVAGPIYFIIGMSATKHTGESHPSLSLSCLMVFATCFNQTVKWLPSSSTRMFTATYVFAMYVTVTMYVAMLTASLTLPTLSPTLNYLEELVESDFSWGIQDLGAADYQLLKSSKVPLYQRVYKGLQQCPSLDGCITRARDTKYAFITWRTYLEDRIAVRFTSSSGERQLHIASGDIFPVELGWAMNPGSPYRHMFNAQIRSQLESGLISKWLDDVINDPKRREVNEDEANLSSSLIQALGLHHLQGVFFILTIGYVTSCLTFICELTCCKKQKSNSAELHFYG